MYLPRLASCKGHGHFVSDVTSTRRCAQVLPKGEIPHTRHVRGSNFVLIGVFEDRLPGRAIIICVIDNLVKVQSQSGHRLVVI